MEEDFGTTQSGNNWFVYILECSDGSLYTGITTNIDRRVKQHNLKKGAKYTKSRTPVKLVYFKDDFDRSSALKEEFRIKKLSRKEKLLLIKLNSEKAI
jgi:putative endonuclease